MRDLKSEFVGFLSRKDFLNAFLVLGKIEDPKFKKETYVETILGIAADIWYLASRARYDMKYKAMCINKVLYSNYGIRGKHSEYKKLIDQPSQFYIHELLLKKNGSPLSMAVLYKILAEQVGLLCFSYSLSPYYYLKVENQDVFYIDPFDGGKFYSPDEFQKRTRQFIKKVVPLSTNLFEKVDMTQLLGRLIQRLKQVYILKGMAIEALRATELLSVIYPSSSENKRDRGILYCEIEYYSKALKDLNNYIKECPDADDVIEIKKLARMIKGYQEIIN